MADPVTLSIGISPRSSSGFVQGYPGIPQNASRSQATVKGKVDLRLPSSGVKAKWLQIMLQKCETIPGIGTKPVVYREVIGGKPINLWVSAFDRWENVPPNDFRFAIPIPESLPPSVSLNNRGNGIEYKLVANIFVKRNGFHLLSNPGKVISSSRTVVIEKHELHSAWPIYHQPGLHQADNEMMSLVVVHDRTCYGLGDCVSLTATLTPHRSYWPSGSVTQFELKLEETHTFYQGPGLSSICPTTTKVIAKEVRACNTHGSPFTTELQVPSRTAPTLTTAKHIRVSHALVIIVGTSPGHIRIEFPLIISMWPSVISKQLIKDIGFTPALMLDSKSPPLVNPGAQTNAILRTLPTLDQPIGIAQRRNNLDEIAPGITLPSLTPHSCNDSPVSVVNEVTPPPYELANLEVDQFQRDFRTATDTTKTPPATVSGGEELTFNSPLRISARGTPTRQGSGNPSPEIPPNKWLLHSLAHILSNSNKSKSMGKLRGDRAQLVIDFLHSVLLEYETTSAWFRKHTLIALYKLSKSAQLYPQHYALQDITLEGVEDGGGFCDIHRGRHQDQELCLKVVRLFQKSETDAVLKLFAKEAILWGQLVHPSIAPFYGVYYLDEAHKRMCLVSPWMKNGNLVRYLKNNPHVDRNPLIYDIVDGLGYLHDENVIHGDLKGVNVLVTDSGRACITDFGLSSVLTDKTMGHTVATSALTGATYRWAAPELLDDSDSRHSRASDIWAFGCVCYQVLTRQVPYHEVSSDGPVIGKILRGGLPARPVGDSDLDRINDDMWDLMIRCWDFDPQRRPTCRQVVEELGQKGFAGTAAQEYDRERFARDNARFQHAMRKRADISLDLTRIEHILNEF